MLQVVIALKYVRTHHAKNNNKKNNNGQSITTKGRKTDSENRNYVSKIIFYVNKRAEVDDSISL